MPVRFSIHPPAAFASLGLLLGATSSVVRAEHPTAVALLAPVDLAGAEQSTVVWTELSSINTALTPAAGAGTIAVNSPGFKASAGFYSFASGYSSTVASAPVDFAVKNVVLQLVGIVVSGDTVDGEVDFTPEDHLTYNGGPVLTYTYAGGTGTLAPVAHGTLGGPLAGSGGGFEGDYYSFTWQWDLSALPVTVTSVSILAPLRSHSSTIGARLDLGDTFTQVVGAPLLTPLQQWRELYFGAAANTDDGADSADPDHDGTPNLLEYALGRDPLAPDAAPPVALGLADGHLTLAFDRIADTSLRYVVEATGDLSAPAGWSDIWTSDEQPVFAGSVLVTDPQALSASPRRFLRLRVETP